MKFKNLFLLLAYFYYILNKLSLISVNDKKDQFSVS